MSFSRSFSVDLMEHKGRSRRDYVQAMASGVATAYAYTKLSPCAGNRTVSLEMQCHPLQAASPSPLRNVVGAMTFPISRLWWEGIYSASVPLACPSYTSCLGPSWTGQNSLPHGSKGATYTCCSFFRGLRTAIICWSPENLHHSLPRGVVSAGIPISEHIAQIYFGGIKVEEATEDGSVDRNASCRWVASPLQVSEEQNCDGRCSGTRALDN